jgi:hypothetical protein
MTREEALAVLLYAKTDRATWESYPDTIKECVDREYSALRAERDQLAVQVATLREALVANTHCLTCEGEKQIALECYDCLCGGSGRCKCSEQQPFECPQCGGRGFDCTPGTVEIVTATREAAMGATECP